MTAFREHAKAEHKAETEEGAHIEALTEIRRALELEPLSITVNIIYSHCLFYTGRIDESEAQMKKGSE